MALVHFLLVFDHGQQRLISQMTFADAELATDAYARLERENRDNRQLEIVLVGADSIETVMQTHGHYFTGTPEALIAV